MNIKTYFVYPPIPIRSYDWLAVLNDDPEGTVGYGRTEQEAIDDLKSQLEDEV